MGDKLLEIKNLFVEYRANNEIVKAINGINLDIEKGETLGLVGETGAGKTSTALSILKLLPEKTGFITEGSINFNNTDIIKASKQDMRTIRGSGVSMIFQDPMTSLNPVMSVGKQIEEILVYHNNDNLSKVQIQEKIDSLLELVGIPSTRKMEYPNQFSGGMKQRIGIAMALACEPLLLIADEPTTALDVTIQAQVLKMMDDLKKKMGTAVLLITHDLGIVARMCQKVAIMYAGEIIEYGTARDIYKSGQNHPYTTGLFESIPSLKERTKRLNVIPGLMPDPTKLPTGCNFYDRCGKRMDICKNTPPKDYVSSTHKIKCHLFCSKEESK